jgi:glycine/D-amino acid oxidase-like deaminating enzyme
LASVIVIGAGVIGASAAYHLALAGADVTVLDANRPAGGTSTNSFSWTNAHNKEPHSYFALNHAGMRAHADLLEHFPNATWLHRTGCVEWAGNADEMREQDARVRRLRDWDYAVEWISPARLGELEPDIDLRVVGDAPIAFYPEEGWLDGALFVQALLAAATARGARLRTGIAVDEIERSGDAVRGVRLAGGEMLPADFVLNCTGISINSVTADAALHVPMECTRGVLSLTAPTSCTLARLIQAPDDLGLRPDGAGRLMVQRSVTDDWLTPGTMPSTDLPQSRDAMERAIRIMPALAGTPVESVRIGTRPIPADGFSCVGFMPGVSGYYVAVTHSGVTLSALLGQFIAEEMVLDRVRRELDDFRPDRFFQSR